MEMKVSLVLGGALKGSLPGRLKAATPSGRALIRLTCDGEAVPVTRADDGYADHLVLAFEARPGNWVAMVSDPESGQVGTVEVTVGTPGSGGWSWH